MKMKPVHIIDRRMGFESEWLYLERVYLLSALSVKTDGSSLILLTFQHTYSSRRSCMTKFSLRNQLMQLRIST